MTPRLIRTAHAPLLLCRRIGRCLFFVFLLSGVAGCPPRERPRFEDGPARALRTTDEIIETINSNAARLDQALWSSSVSATGHYKDREGEEHSFNFDGSLLFKRPRNFRMDLRPGLGEQVMQIGSNEETFWVWIEPEIHSMHWGHHRNAGMPCCEKMPVRPDQLVSALLVGGLPVESEGLYGPIRDSRATYDVLTYHRASPRAEYRRYYVEREPPHLVRLVVFRDELGRDVMSAYLANYKTAWEGGPMLPYDVSMMWAQDGAKLTMSVAAYVPRRDDEVSPKAFNMPDSTSLPAGIDRVVQVDADCETAETAPSDSDSD